MVWPYEKINKSVSQNVNGTDCDSTENLSIYLKKRKKKRKRNTSRAYLPFDFGLSIYQLAVWVTLPSPYNSGYEQQQQQRLNVCENEDQKKWNEKKKRQRRTKIKTTVEAKDTFKNVVRLKNYQNITQHNTTPDRTEHHKKKQKIEWNVMKRSKTIFWSLRNMKQYLSLSLFLPFSLTLKSKVNQEKGKKVRIRTK